MEAQPLQIITSTDDNHIILNEEVLSSILTREEIKDRYICIVSITGVLRQGKSFLLNFLLRYLRVTYIKQRDVTEWLKPEDGPLKGFAWAPGSRRHTTGIHMWSEVFLTKLPTGEEVAIILLDTQGAFDNQTSVSDSAAIFALSTLISSVQIYNVMRIIKQYDLTHLQLFGGYGKSLSNNRSKPFQNLIFMVRDWPWPFDKPYGSEGGRKLLSEVFDNNLNIPEVQAQVNNINELFNDVSCYLLPHPGRVVETSNTFDGCLDEVDEEFRKYVQEFVPSILSPENLVLKTMHGRKIKAGDLVHYIKEYCNILRDGSLPRTETVVQATVGAHFNAALERAVELYKTMMDRECKNTPRTYTTSELDEIHSLNEFKAVEHYGKHRKFDDAELCDKYIKLLRKTLKEQFSKYETINNRKIQAAEEERERQRQIAERAERERQRQIEEAERAKQRELFEEMKRIRQRNREAVERGRRERAAEEIRRKHLESLNRRTVPTSGNSSSSLATADSDLGQTLGTAAAVIGGIAALAFGVSKAFSSRNND